jgi:hypothetical protein
MTRFQLWAWNSVRFRKDIINQAALHGFREGTTEFERFQRMATTDLFIIGLSNVFAYSIFESTLPAPYSWLQDTADWIFGDEKQRDRAFFGTWPSAVAPLQMVTPPILRLGPSAFKAMMTDDWSKFAGYYIPSMFPAGRFARDIYKTIDNPARGVENLTGVPYMQLGQRVKEYREFENPYGYRSFRGQTLNNTEKQVLHRRGELKLKTDQELLKYGKKLQKANFEGKFKYNRQNVGVSLEAVRSLLQDRGTYFPPYAHEVKTKKKKGKSTWEKRHGGHLKVDLEGLM